MTPTQKQGYDDQAAGMLNAALAEADTPAGREYRDGIRARKRAEYDAISRDGIEFAGPPEAYLPKQTVNINVLHADQRINEQLVASSDPEPLQSTEVKVHRCKACDGTGITSRGGFCVPCNGRGYASHLNAPPPAHVGGAFDVAPPAAKKPRKAKPVDDGQASLFG